MSQAPTNQVRAAHRADTAAVVRTLTRAFHDDPVFRWLFPDDATRRRDTARFFAIYAGLDHVPAGRCEVAVTEPSTGTVRGAAIWHSPKDRRAAPLELLRTAPHYLSLFHRRLPRVVRALAHVERQAPAQPHWYLADIGTDPAARGQGVGSALLRSGLARADAERMPTYLESSSVDNIAFYERFGFELCGEITGTDYPTMYRMWRPAQGA
ncbi:GNAT family N-acetyltransferase [Lipingzhangella sp. LS1_29]|uniref:GNAT family N-acetyltransferase n=1 Tax=Lipingzhangella rawalii TaxID=2055835 RepID=A0ABU2HA07_9ACTN|nr:GNAT family N-acetyltransferase [Lipingzhangella rawalii]MDS1272101.1 GNAT family N-acetyltransferase [Lipingzhangella rawalii]